MAERMDMAIARTPVSLRKIPVSDFMEMLRKQDLTATFVAYLATRGAEREQIITDFVTCSAEERLAAALLRIGRRLGRPESGELCMFEPLSCQELSEMVGTTRSRIGYFLGRFRERRLLVQVSKSHFRILESRLTHYLNREPQKA
jgi:CRP-like cAMP-binding protein